MKATATRESRQMTMDQLDRELQRFVEREVKEPMLNYAAPSALGYEAMRLHAALRAGESLQTAQAVADSWDQAREKYRRRGLVMTAEPIGAEFIWALTGWSLRAARLRIPLPRRRRPQKTVIVR